MKEERNKVRSQVLAKRSKLSARQREEKSSMLIDRLWQIEPLHQAGVIFTYVNFRSEVETLAFIRNCLAKHIQICVPLTKPDDFRLIPYQISDPEEDLTPGYCSIPEPATHLPLIDPTVIDVIILPGSVFDEGGGRLGYGGGFYDRFIAEQTSRALRIGLAFEVQVVKTLPLMPHDQKINYLVTENRVLQFDV